ncbi:hypothetical protein Pelo_7984 [Pelomyxa schiedti]|nr:hypothetical protein Pelo_7984 [Pelomyxa schiedti]
MGCITPQVECCFTRQYDDSGYGYDNPDTIAVSSYRDPGSIQDGPASSSSSSPAAAAPRASASSSRSLVAMRAQRAEEAEELRLAMNSLRGNGNLLRHTLRDNFVPPAEPPAARPRLALRVPTDRSYQHYVMEKISGAYHQSDLGGRASQSPRAVPTMCSARCVTTQTTRARRHYFRCDHHFRNHQHLCPAHQRDSNGHSEEYIQQHQQQSHFYCGPTSAAPLPMKEELTETNCSILPSDMRRSVTLEGSTPCPSLSPSNTNSSDSDGDLERSRTLSMNSSQKQYKNNLIKRYDYRASTAEPSDRVSAPKRTQKAGPFTEYGPSAEQVATELGMHYAGSSEYYSQTTASTSPTPQPANSKLKQQLVCEDEDLRNLFFHRFDCLSGIISRVFVYSWLSDTLPIVAFTESGQFSSYNAPKSKNDLFLIVCHFQLKVPTAEVFRGLHPSIKQCLVLILDRLTLHFMHETTYNPPKKLLGSFLRGRVQCFVPEWANNARRQLEVTRQVDKDTAAHIEDLLTKSTF